MFQLIHISRAAPVHRTLHQRASCPLSRSTWLAEPVVIRVILEPSATVRASTQPRRWNAEINMQKHDGRRPRRRRKRKLRLWNNWWVIMGRKWELDDVWSNTLSPGNFNQITKIVNCGLENVGHLIQGSLQLHMSSLIMIGPGNGLLCDGSKPLSAPILTYDWRNTQQNDWIKS